MTNSNDAVNQWSATLRRLLPAKVKLYSDDQLSALVTPWAQLLGTLQIEDPEEQARFMQLAILLTPDQKQSRLISGVVQRILSYEDWDPEARLDFVYKHIVGRPVSKNEEDYGHVFGTRRT